MAPDRWVLVEAGSLDGRGELALDPVESRHLAVTLRLRAGDAVTACDGRGGLAEARLRSVDARRCTLEVVGRLPAQEPPWPPVTVALAALHGQAMDWAVQKCVEVGAATFVPVLSQRSQLGGKAAAGRAGHWRRVAHQALKQCRRPWAMEVSEPVTLARLLGDHADRPGVLADPAGRPLEDLGPDFPDLLLVGPEGGFGETELLEIGRAGWPAVRLGRWVLRADTAAVVGAAALIAAHGRR